MIKKLLAVTIFGLLFSNPSFALSSYVEKFIYDGCYPDVKSRLGAKNAKAYCGCFVKLSSQKWSDEEFDVLTNKSEEYQRQSMQFAVDFCNTKIK
jgi:hypothetical protein|tara:strand:+ start:429 stop:713 length:285 start_codon:yes stop_codon:yes gene_type:complete